MLNNDILRRLRYALNLKDKTMVEIFKIGKYNLTQDEVVNLLKKEEEESFIKCNNKCLENFLDGLIIYKRGELPADKKIEPVKITKNNINNIIFKKLRIALSLKSEDILEILKLANLEISSSELSAIFRNEGHKNYKECGDRYLRNFLKGLVIYYRK